MNCYTRVQLKTSNETLDREVSDPAAWFDTGRQARCDRRVVGERPAGEGLEKIWRIDHVDDLQHENEAGGGIARDPFRELRACLGIAT